MPSVPSDDAPRPDSGPDALAALVEQRDRLVAAIVAHTGLDASRAEDALHNMVERLLRKGLAPRNGEAWFAYLRQAALNQAANDTRHRVRADARELDYLLTGRDAAANSVAVRMLMLDALADLDTLPEQQRRVFWLRHYEGMRVRDIAAVTGLSPRGVESALRRAAERLRALHADRETTPGYLLLAVLATGRRTGTASAPVVTIAAMTALSILTVLTAPAPRAVIRPDVQRRPANAVPGATPARPGGDRANEQRADAAAVDAAIGPESADMLAPRPGGAPPRLPHVLPDPGDTCVGPACVTTGEARPPGDVVALRAAPGVTVSQTIVEACWLIPDNPAATCSSDDPSVYTVRRPTEAAGAGQDRSAPDVKSSPSAPDREPSKGIPQ